MTYSFANSDSSWITKANFDGSFTTFRASENNSYYKSFLAWLDEGNTPLPAPEPEPAPVLTTEQKLEAAGLTVAELRELFGLAEGNEPLPADEPPASES